MRVGIDITSIIYGRGVSRYTSNLVRSLVKIPDLELSLFGSSLRQKEQFLHLYLSLQPAQVSTHFHSWSPKMLEYVWRFGLSSITSQDPSVAVFHSWDYLQPPDKHLPLVSTIHDLAMLKYPDTAHPQVLKAHQRSWKILADRKAHIVTVSYAVQNDILQYLQLPVDHVHVVHSAIPREIKEAASLLTHEQLEVISQTLTLGRPYLLFVGTREPRKNLKRLIEAWQSVQHSFDLVIVGDSGWDESLGQLPATVRLLGQQSDRNLAVLYSNADALLYPSLDEGFGLPILEAFYFGIPVLTSNCGGMAEIAGNAAELVDPLSVESIRQGIEVIVNENADARQLRLQRMIIRKQMFSWKNTAQQTAEVYRLALQDK